MKIEYLAIARSMKFLFFSRFILKISGVFTAEKMLFGRSSKVPTCIAARPPPRRTVGDVVDCMKPLIIGNPGFGSPNWKHLENCGSFKNDVMLNLSFLDPRPWEAKTYRKPILANRGPNSRFFDKANFKPLVPKSSRSLISITYNRAYTNHKF